MKKMNKKGFTIVELVIVIAVIAILAAVLIPTFSGVVDKANASSALQTAKSTLTNALSMSSTSQLPADTKIVVDGYAFNYTGNQIEVCNYPTDATKTWVIGKGGDDDFNAIIISSNSIANGSTAVSDKDYVAHDGSTMTLKNVDKILSVWSDDNKFGCIRDAITSVKCKLDDNGAASYNVYRNYKVGDVVYLADDDTSTTAFADAASVSNLDAASGANVWSTSGEGHKNAYTIKASDYGFVGKAATETDAKIPAIENPNAIAELYVNVDLDKDVVVFTNFGK